MTEQPTVGQALNEAMEHGADPIAHGYAHRIEEELGRRFPDVLRGGKPALIFPAYVMLKELTKATIAVAHKDAMSVAHHLGNMGVAGLSARFPLIGLVASAWDTHAAIERALGHDCPTFSEAFNSYTDRAGEWVGDRAYDLKEHVADWIHRLDRFDQKLADELHYALVPDARPGSGAGPVHKDAPQHGNTNDASGRTGLQAHDNDAPKASDRPAPVAGESPGGGGRPAPHGTAGPGHPAHQPHTALDPSGGSVDPGQHHPDRPPSHHQTAAHQGQHQLPHRGGPLHHAHHETGRHGGLGQSAAVPHTALDPSHGPGHPPAHGGHSTNPSTHHTHHTTGAGHHASFGHAASMDPNHAQPGHLTQQAHDHHQAHKLHNHPGHP
jgi:hypothetical protein